MEEKKSLSYHYEVDILATAEPLYEEYPALPLTSSEIATKEACK